MSMCELSTPLFVGFILGTLVSSLTGSDLAGWLAGLAAFGAIVAVQRLRGPSATSCSSRGPAHTDAGARRSI